MEPDTITNLYDGRPSLAVGDARGMLAAARWDGWLDVRVNVALRDGVTVTHAPVRVRVDHELIGGLGLEGFNVTLDVDARLDIDPEVQFALGMIDEDEYWDRTSYD